jgi:beta-glucosidase
MVAPVEIPRCLGSNAVEGDSKFTAEAQLYKKPNTFHNDYRFFNSMARNKLCGAKIERVMYKPRLTVVQLLGGRDMRRIGLRALGLALCIQLAAALAAPRPLAQPAEAKAFPRPSSPTFAPRVRDLLSKLTLDEKISLTSGARDPAFHGGSGYMPGVARLGIPALRWANGPVGIESIYDLTATPAPMSLAAGFDPVMARRLGDLIGAEARYASADVVNGPDVGIARLPTSGGGYGEDPYLAGVTGRAVVLGIQGRGVMAMPKHFVGYVQGPHAGNGGVVESYDFVIDDRTLHEIYLPPFEMALKAGAASVMAAYSKVNGAYNAQNADNLLGILRKEIGWNGWVNSDWNANRSTESIMAGLDVEMPGTGPGPTFDTPPWWGAKLKSAVQSGQVPMAALDGAVGYFLTQLDIFGLLDHSRVPAGDMDLDRQAATSRAAATEGAVLLQNDGVLPLRPSDLDNLVLIGPSASQLTVGGGVNRAYGVASRAISPLEALKTSAGAGAHIAYAIGDGLTGEAVPNAFLMSNKGMAGLDRDALDGTPTTVDPTVDFIGARALGVGKSYHWSGKLRAPSTGSYVLQIHSWGGAATLSVDARVLATSATRPFGVRIPRQWSSLLPTVDNLDNGQATLKLEAGKEYRIDIQADGEPQAPLQIRLAWVTPETRRRELDLAVAAAKAARTAVVFAFAGRGGVPAAEDGGAGLPNDQDALIEAVSAANPNTVVVLNTGAAVAMPWKDKVRAILQMWYPGQEGGWATADLLLGKANPSGKLPVTFPRKLADTSVLQPGHPERYEGDPVKKQVVFSEGVFVGYRWFDQQKIEPLFPFGHGLSYTTFRYSDLRVQSTKAGIDVDFVLTNMGKVRGAEVAQVYLGPPPKTAAPQPPKTLAAFARMELDPGQSKSATVHVDPRQLSNWDTAGKTWRILPGKRRIDVGSSSKDIRLRTTVAVAPSGMPTNQ